MLNTVLEGMANLYRGVAGLRRDHVLWNLDRAELERQWLCDVHTLRIFVQGIEKATAALEESPELFRKRGLLSLEDRQKLWGLWQAFLDYQIALESIKDTYRDFAGIKLTEEASLHARLFLATYTAFLAQFSCGLRVVNLVQPVEALHVLLNEAVPEFGIHAKSFADLKWNVIHVSSFSAAMAGRAYFHLLAPVIKKHSLQRHEDLQWLFAYLRKTRPRATRTIKVKGLGLFAANTLDIIRGRAFQVWFPIQKRAAKLFGEVHFRDRKERLIGKAQIAEMLKKMKPGDILFERRNWCMSNIGLPGFWPHAALYVGSPGEIEEIAPEVKRRYPGKWSKFCKPYKDRNPHRVIEAVGEGVIFNSFEHSAGADYVCALRPRHADVPEAILRAFHYQGRPYDFDFDFSSDSTLVCSELVWKCYQPGRHQKGIRWPLIEVAGRPVLPANEMVKQFVREFDDPDPQLEFVHFIDAIEEEQRAVVRPVDALLMSPYRPKWDFLQA
jgi:hypothetical protein